MSKTCQEAIELMNLYLDGRLSGGQYQDLAKHLEDCEHCRKRMNYLRVISSELRKDRPAMPDDLHSSIMNYIAKANAPAEPRRFPLKKLQKTLALCAAALVLVLVTPVALKSIRAESPTSDLSTAQSESWLSRLFSGMFQAQPDSEESDQSDNEKDPGSDQNDSSQSGAAGNNAGTADTDRTNETITKTEGAYTVPALRTNERFANYVVATGTAADLQLYFDLTSVAVYPEDGSIYVCLPNNAGSWAKVYASIRSMGLTLQLSPQGLPKADENAPEILFVIFPK